MREYEPNEWYNNIYDLGNLCLQNSSGVMGGITPYTEKEANEIKKKNPGSKVVCLDNNLCIVTGIKSNIYLPPKLKKCSGREEFYKENLGNYYDSCCPDQEFNLLMLQRFLEKKKESGKLEEFKDYYGSLTKIERQEITQEIIKQEEMYSRVTRDFRIVKPYELLPENQTTIFIFLFFILLIFLKSFRRYFLRKG
ncbi:hypothetical protein BKN14_04050 [Candidatus Gracilibacteria bacterium HOT-871]|nr:hypothetical protein BKN14_04050 [Candidatus Gracilibacteria bacterium HOT-871]